MYLFCENLRKDMVKTRSSHRGVLLKRCSQKFRKIHWKTPVPKTLNKVAGLSGRLLLENLNISNVTDNKLFWKSVKPLLLGKSRLRYRINISEKGRILTL